jgi:hypothetical protein
MIWLKLGPRCGFKLHSTAEHRVFIQDNVDIVKLPSNSASCRTHLIRSQIVCSTQLVTSLMPDWITASSLSRQ